MSSHPVAELLRSAFDALSYSSLQRSSSWPCSDILAFVSAALEACRYLFHVCVAGRHFTQSSFRKLRPRGPPKPQRPRNPSVSSSTPLDPSLLQSPAAADAVADRAKPATDVAVAAKADTDISCIIDSHCGGELPSEQLVLDQLLSLMDDSQMPIFVADEEDRYL